MSFFDLSSLIEKKTLFGAFLGAGLVWFGEYVKAWYNKSKDAHYLAIRMIGILELFIDGCYDVACDDGTIQGQPANSDGSYSPQVVVPTLILPDDVVWKSIDKSLVEEIMSLPVELYNLNKTLSIEAEFAEHDYSDFMHFRQLHFSKFSLKVDSVLTKLKKTIKHPEKQYTEHWNPREWCEKFIFNYELRMKKIEGNNARK